MLKMMMPPLVLLSWKKFNLSMTLMPLMIMYLSIKLMNNKMMIINQICSLDQLSLLMIMLTLMSITLIILSSNQFNKMMYTMMPMLIILMLTFSMNNMFSFYMLFELILIPILMLISKLGAQPERLQAGIYLIMYTITSSLPLLMSILLMKNNSSFMMLFISMYKFKFILFLMMAFLIKMPMFFTHLWLPKAHVEAPLEGSMILAAVLLKLGGYGLIRMFPLCLHKIFMLNYWLLSISVIGATSTCLICIRQKDLKSLIAYSSVAHMALVLSGLYTMNLIGLSGAVFMMIAHGLSSSALFFLVNDLYLKLHSRNILMFKGLITIMPNISFWWFMFMAINISAPPSINTISEIFIMSSMLLWSKTMITPIFLMTMAAASFSLSMFINISHNKNYMLMFMPSPQKTFLSLFSHLFPLIIILFKMEMLYLN